MTMRTRIILVIVEGQTDKETLSFIVDSLKKNPAQTRFHVVGGDITSDWNIGSQELKRRLGKIVKDDCRKYFLRTTDYIEVIQLVDTDGAFIADSGIVESLDGMTLYHPDRIETENVYELQRRNAAKARALKMLASTPKIAGIPYSCYYFSANLEHVFHDEQNANRDGKNRLADCFVTLYEKDSAGFLQLFEDKQVFDHTSYAESWEAIKRENKSLSRHSNFNQLFGPLAKNECLFG